MMRTVLHVWKRDALFLGSGSTTGMSMNRTLHVMCCSINSFYLNVLGTVHQHEGHKKELMMKLNLLYQSCLTSAHHPTVVDLFLPIMLNQAWYFYAIVVTIILLGSSASKPSTVCKLIFKALAFCPYQFLLQCLSETYNAIIYLNLCTYGV